MPEGIDAINKSDLEKLTEAEFNKIMPYLERARKHPADFYKRLKNVIDNFIEGEPAKGPVQPVAVEGVAPVGVSIPMAVPEKPKRTPAKSVNFVRDNLDILDGNETATVLVSYRDLEGEITKVPEKAADAFNDIESVSDMLYKFRECIKS